MTAAGGQPFHLWLIEVHGHTVTVSPYLLLNGIGLIIALYAVDHRLKRLLPENHHAIYVLFVISMLFGWLGALGYSWILTSSTGFTFYGGLLSGGTFFYLASSTFLPQSIVWRSLNIAVAPLALAHCIGRFGCHFSGCCGGKPLNGSDLLSLFFTNHPTQLYEATFLFLFSMIALHYEKVRPNSSLPLYCTIYGVFRFIIDPLRVDFSPIAGNYSPTQLLSAVLFVSMVWIPSKWTGKRLVRPTQTYRTTDN